VRDFDKLDEYEIETIVYNKDASNSQSFLTTYENQDGTMVLSDDTNGTNTVIRDDFTVAAQFNTANKVSLFGMSDENSDSVVYVFSGNTLINTILKDGNVSGFWQEDISISNGYKIQIVSTGQNGEITAKEYTFSGSYSAGSSVHFKEISVDTTPGYLNIDETIIVDDMLMGGLEITGLENKTAWYFKYNAGSSWELGGYGDSDTTLDLSSGTHESVFVKTVDVAGNEYTKEYKDITIGAIFSGAETNSGSDNYLSASGYAAAGSAVSYSGYRSGIVYANANGYWSVNQYLGSSGRGMKSMTFSGHGDDDITRSFSVSERGYDPITELEDGGYVVTWISDSSADTRDDDGFGVFAQRYAQDGTLVGNSFLVNTHTLGNQTDSDVVGLKDGGYIVTWQSENQDGSSWGVYSQRFDVNNEKVGIETLINETTQNSQISPEITSLENGGYVVVWQSEELSANGSFDIYVKVYNELGEVVSSETLVNNIVENSQELPQITNLTNGGFVVTWQSFDIDSNKYEVKTQTYDSNGNKDGDIVEITKDTLDENSNPFVSSMSNGGYVLSWINTTQNEREVVTQMFNSQGVATTNEVVVDTFVGDINTAEIAQYKDSYAIVIGTQDNVTIKVMDGETEVKEIVIDKDIDMTEPHITSLKDGGFLTTWTEVKENGNMQVVGQRFTEDASKTGDEFAIGKVVNNDTSRLILEDEYADINFDALAASLTSDKLTIDMSEGNYTVHDVKLEDVLIVSDSSNDLVFVGDNGDKIDLSNNDEWSKSENKIKIDGEEDEFFVYTNTKDPASKLFIDEDISVI